MTARRKLLIENPINRYLINSPMLSGMKKNADGSLTLYIQKDIAGQGEGSQLAARAQRHHLPGDASVLAQGHAAFDLAARRGNLEAPSYRGFEIEACADAPSPLQFRGPRHAAPRRPLIWAVEGLLRERPKCPSPSWVDCSLSSASLSSATFRHSLDRLHRPQAAIRLDREWVWRAGLGEALDRPCCIRAAGRR